MNFVKFFDVFFVIPNNSHARNVPFAGFGENTDGGDMGVLLTAEGNGTGVEFQSPRHHSDKDQSDMLLMRRCAESARMCCGGRVIKIQTRKALPWRWCVTATLAAERHSGQNRTTLIPTKEGMPCPLP